MTIQLSNVWLQPLYIELDIPKNKKKNQLKNTDYIAGNTIPTKWFWLNSVTNGFTSIGREMY